MNTKFLKTLIMAMAIPIAWSCSTTNNIAYIQDRVLDRPEEIDQNAGIVIQPKDQISIVVSSRNPELVPMFNLPVVSYQAGSEMVSSAGSQRLMGYSVDNNGDIDFPILGKLHVAGMTRWQLSDMIKDMLLDIDIPDYVGYDDPEQNTGKMRTTGYEIEIGWNDVVGDWSYGISANLSDYLSEMGWLGGTQFLGDQVKMMGSYFNEWYGYKSDGLFQTQEEIDNYPVLNSNVKPGDIKYLKADPNDTSPLSPDKDRVLLGNSLPRWQYGATVYAGWRGIDLNIVMQGVGYRLSRIAPTMIMPLRDNWGNIPAMLDGNYWSHYNTPEQNLNAKYPRLTYSQQAYNFGTMSDFWLFNGGYFRLKNITLGYTLPQHITKKAAIQKLRFYISANDLLCISNYPKGWDPEVGTSTYPITTTVVGGVQINF